MIRGASIYFSALVCLATAQHTPAAASETAGYDVLISGATIYDGSGGAAYIGDVAIRGDRIAYVGPHAPHGARDRVDAHGKAVRGRAWTGGGGGGCRPRAQDWTWPP